MSDEDDKNGINSGFKRPCKEQFGALVVRRDRENQSATECPRARGFDLDPTLEHHTGPRHADGRIRGRIHVSTR